MKKLILNILKENEDKLFDRDYQLIKNYFKRKFDSGSWEYEKYKNTLTVYDETSLDPDQHIYSYVIFEYDDKDIFATKGLVDLLKEITGESWSYNKWFIVKFIQEEFNLEVDSIQIT